MEGAHAVAARLKGVTADCRAAAVRPGAPPAWARIGASAKSAPAKSAGPSRRRPSTPMAIDTTVSVGGLATNGFDGYLPDLR